MNRDQFLGQWHIIKGQLKSKWAKLTDDDIKHIDGKREELLGRLQKHYGYAKEKAEEELTGWERSLKLHSEEKQKIGR